MGTGTAACFPSGQIKYMNISYLKHSEKKNDVTTKHASTQTFIMKCSIRVERNWCSYNHYDDSNAWMMDDNGTTITIFSIEACKNMNFSCRVRE